MTRNKEEMVREGNGESETKGCDRDTGKRDCFQSAQCKQQGTQERTGKDECKQQMRPDRAGVGVQRRDPFHQEGILIMKCLN